ncbi:unnamed protein product [Allacma fusca]|uniref:3-hydroxyisobutyryl-CoA hydrolase, mitochondrial n=1 Tax=Allacma fusca TaxID=39272 RepID=A0A8J2MDR7_9HEXA|nr:unnamed protein product [Allacma fusca]
MSSNNRSPGIGEELQATSEEQDVILESVNRKGIITLNRPKALNALNLSMLRKIYPVLKEWESSQKFVIIKGSGGRAFCAGGDVRAVTDSATAGTDLYKDFFREEYMLNALVGTLHIPYIALIDGITMGGGVGLSVHGQYRVATEKTVFAMPETAIGLFPDVGGSYFLPRLGGRLGLFLALTGYRLKGGDCLRAGIATHVCNSDTIDFLEQDLISLEASDSTPAGIETILQRYNDLCPAAKQSFSLQDKLTKIDAIFKADSIEGIISGLKTENSEWSLGIVDILSKMSPTSLKTTFKLLVEGADLDLQQCLKMEYRLSQRCCETHDFIEGVRALLVDKDQKPQWDPRTLADVTDSYVNTFFAPLPADRELKL